MAIVVDTHKLHTMLTKAGFDRQKADVLVEAFSTSYEELATKLDLEALRKDIRNDMAVLKKDLVIQQWVVGTAVVAVLSAIRFF